MVDAEEVEKVAENARIEIDEEEAEEFADDFEEILDMFETLDEIDTEDVEPAFHPVETESKSREDEEEETLEKEEVFRNTGNEEEGYFKGPSA
jgi:aspartyl-tRNA(Asn)/glutamyl-tRNA(Gln) amidotransferase subunit C